MSYSISESSAICLYRLQHCIFCHRFFDWFRNLSTLTVLSFQIDVSVVFVELVSLAPFSIRWLVFLVTYTKTIDSMVNFYLFHFCQWRCLQLFTATQYNKWTLCLSLFTLQHVQSTQGGISRAHMSHEIQLFLLLQSLLYLVLTRTLAMELVREISGGEQRWEMFD